MPTRYNDTIKEEARSLYLQGLGYKNIANKLKEQYDIKLAHTTVREWSLANNWAEVLDEQRKVIHTNTNTSTTQSVEKHIKTLQAVQNKFVEQLASGHFDVRATEMVNVIRMMLTLEGAKDVKETLIKELAEKLPEAMKKAKISQKKINLTIRYWIEMVKEME